MAESVQQPSTQEQPKEAAPAAAPTAAVAEKEPAAAEKIQGPPKTVVAARVTGTVKWFNVKSGYGFINRYLANPLPPSHPPLHFLPSLLSMTFAFFDYSPFY